MPRKRKSPIVPQNNLARQEANGKGHKKVDPITQNAIANTEAPPNEKLPGILAQHWLREFKKEGIRAREMKASELKNWGGFKAISQATDSAVDKQRHGTCLVAEVGPAKAAKTLVLVGKGIIFDSGGMQIKIREQEIMKRDMGGISYVRALMRYLAKGRELKWRVVGVMPMVINGIGADAVLPGSVIKMENGRQVEILHTDAEGRLVLADAMSWAAKKYKPDLMLDFATLTGAALVITDEMGGIAMGHIPESMQKALHKALQEEHEEMLWLPLWKKYKHHLKSKTNPAWLTNIPTGTKAGTMMAGLFLDEFVPSTIPWVHFDIAGVAHHGWGIMAIAHWLRGIVA